MVADCTFLFIFFLIFTSFSFSSSVSTSTIGQKKKRLLTHFTHLSIVDNHLEAKLINKLQ